MAVSAIEKGAAPAPLCGVVPTFLRAAWRFLRRAAFVVFVLCLILMGEATRRFVGDPLLPADRLAAARTDLEALQLRAQASIAQEEGELAGQVALLDAKVHELARAGRVVDTLRSLENTWDRWFGAREQQRLNAGAIERLEERQKALTKEIQALGRERDTVQRRVTAAQARAETLGEALSHVQPDSSVLYFYLWNAWQSLGRVLLIALFVILLGPAVGRILLYYVLAPRLARGRALRLGEVPEVWPQVSVSSPSLEVALWPGEILRVRPDHVRNVDDDLAVTTRWLLDWSLPLSSLACGFLRTREIHHRHIGGRSCALLAGNARTELTEVSVPEGGSLVVRPSQVAGLVTRSGQRLCVRRRWRLFHWQSWTTGQFAHFEFHGHCRVILSASAPLRVERLAPRQERRVPREAAVAFTPGVLRRPIRSERFWRYYGGRSALFDQALSGEGLVLVVDPAKARASSRLKRLKSRALRAFGL